MSNILPSWMLIEEPFLPKDDSTAATPMDDAQSRFAPVELDSQIEWMKDEISATSTSSKATLENKQDDDGAAVDDILNEPDQPSSSLLDQLFQKDLEIKDLKQRNSDLSQTLGDKQADIVQLRAQIEARIRRVDLVFLLQNIFDIKLPFQPSDSEQIHDEILSEIGVIGQTEIQLKAVPDLILRDPETGLLVLALVKTFNSSRNEVSDQYWLRKQVVAMKNIYRLYLDAFVCTKVLCDAGYKKDETFADRFLLIGCDVGENKMEAWKVENLGFKSVLCLENGRSKCPACREMSVKCMCTKLKRVECFKYRMGQEIFKCLD
ncbi:hypothetical protein HDU97_005055 [Phlyctochytrium planicorne]|nr:hypothetical protein HDU97_005055 [Phlyctochytrium planicorne]